MTIYPVKGIRLATASAGIRYRDRDDLVVIECQPGSSCATVFTRNKFSAAPVQLAKLHITESTPRAFLVNSGNANAGTGEEGMKIAARCCELLAAALGREASEVLPYSTGVIGEQMPVEAFEAAIPGCVKRLSAEVDAWERAAKAIMTTDTVPKLFSRKINIAGWEVSITGMAKGAGMIRPDMATMLAFIATDAVIEQPVLQLLLDEATGISFNRITVDGDTSTNDACTLLASGALDMVPIAPGSKEYAQFSAVLSSLMQELAQSIIRDAEGASKFITINVAGGESETDCLAVAYTVAESPLVKTALFASDPNWGRILAAVGRAPVSSLDIGQVNIILNGVAIVTAGEPDSAYTEEAGMQAVAGTDITVEIKLGSSAEAVTVWTSDLSHEYIRINAEYRT
ncbi:MAG: bifunctional glutamate N-acetyltransferase/amino-acid acetyltransferase ArgJ [Gammaproteobacteria bacterium]|nr:MAG: bifunctional glutamate N-acetyltransferase/amino-acid acetyltransferase ArgJ [Gammaproteobacteria bacterium]